MLSIKTQSTSLQSPTHFFHLPSEPKLFSLNNKPKKATSSKNLFSMARELEIERKNKKKQNESKTKHSPTEPNVSYYEKNLIQHSILFETPSLSTSKVEPLLLLVDTLIDKLSYMFDKEVSTTSIFIGESNKFSSLQNTEISIKCYDMDPCRVHIDFFTTASGVQFLNSHLTSLSSHLQQALPKTFFSIAKPSLNTYSSKIRKDEIKPFMRKNRKTGDSF